MDLHATVTRALAASGAPSTVPVEPLVAALRAHVAPGQSISHHIAQHTKAKVQALSPDGERFAALHDELRARGVPELDKFTVFLQRALEEKAVVEMLRQTAVASSSASAAASTTIAPSTVAVERPPPEGTLPPPAAAAYEAGWLLSRPYLSGAYLSHGTREQLAGVKPHDSASAAAALAALPTKEQESLLVHDLLNVLAGVEGSFIRASPAAPGSLDGLEGGAGLVPSPHAAKSARIHFSLPSGKETSGIDPSLRELALRLLPLGERYYALNRFAHAKLVNLDSGYVMHAFCASLKSCLQEHVVGITQLEQQHKSRGLSLHQLWYYLQPAGRSLSVLDDIVASVGNCRGGALLRALHERRTVLSGDVESSELLEFLLDKTARPFLEMLHAWVHEGICRDPYNEFMIVERPTEMRDELVTDFNCQYWQRRFYLAPQQVPAFLEQHAEMILTTGKSLHVVRECGRMPPPRPRPASITTSTTTAAKKGAATWGLPSPAQPATTTASVDPSDLPFTLEERSLSARLQKASTTAATQLVSLLMSEHQLMARLASVKHYFLLDQGDFFIHFLDSAEAELTKPVGEISRARLQAKLDIALRQSAVADPYRESLTCGLLPYNLTNQLLRIINASKTASAAPPPPQPASRTPGLDAFTFEYEVSWPLSLLLSKHAITKYQLLFRHLFHCKHVERQLSSSWLSQQEAKQLLGISSSLTAAFGLRQRMLHFLFNIQHYMMFEVRATLFLLPRERHSSSPAHERRRANAHSPFLLSLTHPPPHRHSLQVIEPNFHILTQKLRAASSFDALLTHHGEFLDASLRECMLRDAVLLKLLAKLLTICVIFADQTRIVMADVAVELAASPLPPSGHSRRERLRELSDTVGLIVHECKYHMNVVKLAAKFDEELKRLLDELRKQAHREWNLTHLCSRLDYNSYWSTPAHAQHGAAAAIMEGSM